MDGWMDEVVGVSRVRGVGGRGSDWMHIVRGVGFMARGDGIGERTGYRAEKEVDMYVCMSQKVYIFIHQRQLHVLGSSIIYTRRPPPSPFPGLGFHPSNCRSFWGLES